MLSFTNAQAERKKGKKKARGAKTVFTYPRFRSNPASAAGRRRAALP